MIPFPFFAVHLPPTEYSYSARPWVIFFLVRRVVVLQNVAQLIVLQQLQFKMFLHALDYDVPACSLLEFSHVSHQKLPMKTFFVRICLWRANHNSKREFAEVLHFLYGLAFCVLPGPAIQGPSCEAETGGRFRVERSCLS